MKRTLNRRQFLRAAAGVGAGVMVLRSGILAAGASPNDKLNIAVIGVGSRGRGNLSGVSSENIAALCDCDERNLAKAAKDYPNAKTYTDWRKCLEQKDLNAVVCSTTDHTHAFINVWAMNRGLSVYCEKPLASSVQEARVVRETYLKNKDKVATQMGTQIHATENYRRVVEMIRGGMIGAVKDCHVWCSRTPKGGTYLPAQPVPEGMHWDLWLGPCAADHPFNNDYIHGGCLAWNLFWDFSAGQIGDMGSHLIDLAFWALDLRFPTSCQAEGTALSADTCPQWLKAKWEHPANDWRGPINLNWYDGGKKPGLPTKVFNREELFKGLLFVGDKGWLLADYGFRIIMPKLETDDLTYYKTPTADSLIPKSKGHHKEWIDAAKGDKKTLCNFDYSGALIENNLLATVAYRCGKDKTVTVPVKDKTVPAPAKDKENEQETTCVGPKLEWDAKALKATNCPAADQFITKKYRDGWTLNG